MVTSTEKIYKDKMLKHISFAAIIVIVRLIDFDGIYNDATSAVSSAAGTVADTASSAATYVADGAS